AKLDFADEPSAVTFADYLAAETALCQRRDSVDAAIERLWPDSPHAATIARLRAFRGIDTLTAAGLCAEVGDFARFRKPALLAGYLGITPTERTSDEKRRQGQITKAGSGHARRLLVEAAHHYARRPASSCAAANRASTRGWSRSPGAPSSASTAAGHTSALSARSRRARSRWRS